MNVVVTGASSGIGYEIVKELVRANVHTIYAISRNRNQLDALKEECKSIGNTEVIVLPIDLCEINTMDLNSVINNETIDIIINNAGYLVNKPFENISLQQLEQVYQTNVFGPFLLIQQLLSNLKKSKIAHIVNIGSMGGVQGASKFPGLSAYSSSKAAIASLSECLAEELKKDNIKVSNGSLYNVIIHYYHVFYIIIFHSIFNIHFVFSFIYHNLKIVIFVYLFSKIIII